MRRLFYAIAAFVFLQGVTLLSASAADPPARGAKWSCECETYGGSKDNCYMYADINGKIFDFGAFETSGSGTYRVNRMARETVVTGLIRTQTGTPMKVIIATPLKGSSRVYIDRRKAGDEVFTAQCKGHF